MRDTALRPLRSLGQNFLRDESVAEQIVTAAGVLPDETVLEIGPGRGALTRLLADSPCAGVVAVEIDRGLSEELERTYAGTSVRVLHEDILKLDLRNLAISGPLVVIANLPYNITTPVVMKLIEAGSSVIDRMVIMVQREVALRMQAGPGSKAYGALSLAVQYLADVSVLMDVPPEAFTPRPSVYSSVVRLRILESPLVHSDYPDLMRRLIRVAFGQRRKTLVNAVSAGIAGADRSAVAEALATMGLSEDIRGERLTLRQFAQLSDLMGARWTNTSTI